MLERLLIEHGAPTLARIKVGNLIQTAVPDPARFDAELASLTRRLASKGVALTVLKRCSAGALVYVYRPQKLAEALSRPEIAAFLADAGYGDLSIGAALATLSSHLTCGEAFPHEIGVFLGYPLEDVLAFIRHRGQGCGLCGCWKAYHNLSEAARIFALYDRCRRIYTRLHTGGRSLEQLTVAV